MKQFKRRSIRMLSAFFCCLFFFSLSSLGYSANAADGYSVAKVQLGIQFNTLVLEGSSASSKIQLIFDHDYILDTDVTSSESIALDFAPLEPHLGLVAGVIRLDFPSAEYMQGQSYKFSFKLGGGQSNNNTAVLIPPSSSQTQLQLITKFSIFENWYELGDTVPSWSNYYEEAYGINTLGYSPLKVQEAQLWNNSVFSLDFSIPSDYTTVADRNSDGSFDTYNNRLYMFFIMRSNYLKDRETIYLSNFSLTPTGATKQLYAQQEHNLLVEEKLSNIQEGIEEGFSNVTGELNEGFSNVSGELNEGFSNISGELEEGFSNLLELPEQEYDFGTQEGSEGVDSLVGAIDDKGPGFFNAIGNLITTVSYSGTEAKWTFPALKIPKIGNITTEIQLSNEMPIDFNYWINKIPDKILSTIRYVLTIALICFCFYELYDTIEESLKGKEKKKP